MKKCIKIVLALLLLTSSILADDSGTITEDIQFTTMDGDSYSLFSLLDEDKHVFVAFIKIFF